MMLYTPGMSTRQAAYPQAIQDAKGHPCSRLAGIVQAHSQHSLVGEVGQCPVKLQLYDLEDAVDLLIGHQVPAWP